MNSENHSTDLPESSLGRFNLTNDQPQRCDDIEPMIPAHSIGATDPNEVVQINALLSECPRSAATLATYRQLATRLLYSAPPAIAPQPIADRLRVAIGMTNASPAVVRRQAPPRLPFMRLPVRRNTASARRSKRLTPLPAAMANYALQPDADGNAARFGQQPPLPLAKSTKPSRRWLFVRPLAAAAVVALLVGNVALLLQNQQLQLQQDILAADLAQQNRALIFLAAEEPQELEIFDPAGLSSARADILWNNSLGLAVIYVRDFPECEAGMKYQLWLTKDGQRSSGGLFSVDAKGMGLLVLSLDDSLDLYDVIGITPEPASGSPGPTAPPVVRGEI